MYIYVYTIPVKYPYLVRNLPILLIIPSHFLPPYFEQ